MSDCAVERPTASRESSARQQPVWGESTGVTVELDGERMAEPPWSVWVLRSLHAKLHHGHCIVIYQIASSFS